MEEQRSFEPSSPGESVIWATLKSRLATSLLVAVLALVPSSAPSDCNHPRDLAENDRCFVAWFPCRYAFFGLDAPPDYAKALACFQNSTQEPGPFVALIYYNGDGTPRDLQKAEAGLKTWQRGDPREFDADQAATLQTAIDNCKRNGQKSCPRIDYCTQLAGGTFDLEICDAVEQVREEAKLNEKIARIQSTLNAKDRALFDQMVSAFKRYELREGQRGYSAMADGTARGLAFSDQAAFARDDFAKLIAQTIEKRDLKPADQGVYRATDDELGGLYRRDLRETVEAWRLALNDPAAKGYADQMRSYIAEYEKDARGSQLDWIKFRDSYVKLANSLYQDRTKLPDPAFSARTAVTKLRIAELRHQALQDTPEAQ